MEDRVEWEQAVGRIVDYLDGWILMKEGPRDSSLYLFGPNDTRVLASRPWNQKDKIEFSVSPDNGLYAFEKYAADEHRPKAAVSIDRDPKAAAKDVKRRCLGPAVPYVQELREKKAASDAVNTARFRTLDTLADACGGRVVGQYNHPAEMEKPMDASARRGEHGGPSVKVSLTYGEMVDSDTYIYGPDRVKMEIDYLGQQDAADLLRWLRFRLWPENGQQGKLL